ncbi:hypothetical protein F5Y12DRAFT_737726 [Xylaria sp. FL1777]|nr:hypothetical protein F5Y12DRAFT_737726 [Xylaria sp. FL1777]
MRSYITTSLLANGLGMLLSGRSYLMPALASQRPDQRVSETCLLPLTSNPRLRLVITFSNTMQLHITTISAHMTLLHTMTLNNPRN